MNPGFGLLAIAHGQTSLLTGMVTNQQWGRILCTYLMLDRAGGQTVAMITAGTMTVLGIVLLLLSVLFLRKRLNRCANELRELGMRKQGLTESGKGTLDD